MSTAYYTVAEVSGILGIEPHRVRELARRSLVGTHADPEGAQRFTFQDLVLLRTAAGLLDNQVPLRRIKQALEAVARDLPRDRPLSAVRVRSEGRRVVAEGDRVEWEPATGQLRLDLDEGGPQATIFPLPNLPQRESASVSVNRLSADEWYTLGRDLEESSADEARDAYRRALELDPFHSRARINLSRLLHDAGRFEAAEAHYRLIEQTGPSAAAAFNLGVLLEDGNRLDEAEAAYQRALELDPEHPGALLNLAKMYEYQGRKTEALRALKAYYAVVKELES